MTGLYRAVKVSMGHYAYMTDQGRAWAEVFKFHIPSIEKTEKHYKDRYMSMYVIQKAIV